MPSTQKQLRDLERLQRKYGSNEELIKRKEEILKQKDDTKRKEKERKYSQKYHMVKFMERKKLIRKLKKARKAVEEGDISAEETVDKLYDDLTYVLYFPKDMKYMSILTDDSIENEDISKIEKLKLKAKERARELRELDIQEGREDKVAHAIEVETNPNKVKRKTNNYDHNDDNDDNDKDKDDSYNCNATEYKNSRKSKMKHNISENNRLVGTSTTADDYSQSSKRQKTNTSSSSSSIPPTTSRRSDKAIDKKNIITATTKDDDGDYNVIMNKNNLTNEELHVTETEKKDIDNNNDDDFFLTENDTVDNDTTMNSNKEQVVPQVKVNIGDLKRMKGSITNKKMTIENDGTLTKQELRLLNWQLKVRGKRKF